jgi:hypothetical protein
MSEQLVMAIWAIGLPTVAGASWWAVGKLQSPRSPRWHSPQPPDSLHDVPSLAVEPLEPGPSLTDRPHNQLPTAHSTGGEVQTIVPGHSRWLTKHANGRKCSGCGRRCRKHIHSSSWNHPLGQGYNLCDDCIALMPDRDDWSHWMGFDFVR